MSILKTAAQMVAAKTRRSGSRIFLHTRRVFAVAVVGLTVNFFSVPLVVAEGIGAYLTIAQQTISDKDRDATKLEGEGKSIFGGSERLPTIVEGGRLTLPPIATATTATSVIGNGSLPISYTGSEGTTEEVLREQINQRDAMWALSRYEFAAANTFSHPLYFEDVMLERHGHERFPKLTPMISGTRFFATVPMLPYLMTVRPACDCEYKMGHFRVGDCVYPYIQRPPYERNAVIVEAAAIAGASIALP